MNIKHVQKHVKIAFMDEDQIGHVLDTMWQDDSLRTEAGFQLNTSHINVPVSFHDKHINYLRTHPRVNPADYLANLHTMIKIRPKN